MDNTELDYALMAGEAYFYKREPENRLPAPSGATLLGGGLGGRELTSGYEARAYHYNGQIVISFAGTYFPNNFLSGVLSGDINDADQAGLLDWGANLNLGAGFLSRQLKDAAQFYQDIKRAHPGATISFTGHSLGGGLAALMGVMFDKQAITFDPAPFRSAATEANAQALQAFLRREGYPPDADLDSYTAIMGPLAVVLPEVAAGLLALSGLGGPLASAAVTAFIASGIPTTIRGEANVQQIAVAGEFLTGNDFSDFRNRLRIGTGSSELIPHGSLGKLTGGDAHSISLLYLLGKSTGFQALTQRLPELLPTIFDRAVYAFSVDTPDTNFAEHLVRQELATSGTPSSSSGSGFLDKFVADLNRIASDQGVSAAADMRRALTVLALDYYHASSATTATQFYTLESGALHFNLDDIDADSLKGLGLLLNAASSTAIGSDPFETGGLREASRWHIQTGGGGMNWQAGALANDAAVGGRGADVLRAGGGRDVLLGGDGDDMLDGGSDADTLLGGTGNDTYAFSTGHGQDVVLDAGGQGRLTFDGVALAIGRRLSEDSEVWEDTTQRYRITRIDSDTLRISAKSGQDSITVKGWRDGDLGLRLNDDVEEPEETPTSLVYLGDQRAPRIGIEVREEVTEDNPIYGLYDWATTSWQPDGTLLGGIAEEGFADVINAAQRTQSVQMFGLGGNDALTGGSGADRIDGGNGNDLIGGGAGADEIRGGAGSDLILSGQVPNPRQRQRVDDVLTLPPGARVMTSGPTWARYSDPVRDGYFIHANAASTANSGHGTVAGDRVDAGTGDDYVIGSDAADTLLGGQGGDTIHGAGGGDHLLGGTEADRLYGDGPVSSGHFNTTAPERHGNDLIEGGAGNDRLVGDGGADHLLGGDDDDILFGDGDGDGDVRDVPLGGQWHGQDVLLGQDGRDELYGGGGDDILLGGAGSDVLFGDDTSDRVGWYTVDVVWHGNDRLFGGAGDDGLVGGAGNDWLDGGEDDDLLWGDGRALNLSHHGNDTLLGGAGNDTLYGEGGDDLLDGGSGTNYLSGGAGDDTYLVRTADLAQTGSAEGQPLQTRTVLSDTEGSNLVRIDASRSDVTLLPMEGAGLLLRWSAGEGQVAAMLFDTMASAASFSVEFAGGQRVALARWMGDELNTELDAESRVPNALLAGAAGNDRLAVQGARGRVVGGRGDDVITLDAQGAVVQFDRGDGHDRLQGWGENHRIAFGPGIAAEHLGLRLTAEGELAIAVANADGSDGADRISLPIWSWSLLHSSFVSDIILANGSTVSWSALLARGVRIEADSQPVRVVGTPARDVFQGVASGATLAGKEGDDEYHVEAGATAVIEDAVGRNRIVFGTQSATDWSAVHVERAAPDANGRVSNDLVLSAGGASIRLLDVLILGDRFEVALADGRVRSLAEVAHALPRVGVLGGDDADYLMGGGGNDVLMGFDGNDVFEGQGGSDTLLGGDGDDEYRIDFSIGSNLIHDVEGLNRVRFAPDVQPVDLQIERLSESTDVRLWVDAERSLTVRRALEGAVARYEFADGTVWTPESLIARVVEPDGEGLSLFGTAGDNRLSGSALDDVIVGDAGNDSLSGHGGRDELHGGRGRDTLIGGADDDVLLGGEGDDHYHFNLGDGVDRINDIDGATRLQFGAGVEPQALTATREMVMGSGHVRLNYGVGDAILIPDDLPLDALQFAFASGEVWRAQDLYAKVLVGNGTPVVGSIGNDVLYGHADSDTLQALGGMDTLLGGAGSDVLDGGEGSDHLHGGQGLDSYLLRAGAGLERIHEAPGQASRLLLEDIAPTSLEYARIGDDLLVHHNVSGVAAFISGAWLPESRWTLVDAQGFEQDLMALAALAIQTQDPQARRNAFALAADAQAGPMAAGISGLDDQALYRTDVAGTFMEGVGTTQERAYAFERSSERIEDDSDIVELHLDRNIVTTSRELIRRETIEVATWATWVASYEQTTVLVPDRYEFLTDYYWRTTNADGDSVLARDARVVEVNGVQYVFTPGGERTVSIPIYESGWVYSERAVDYYRDTYNTTRTTLEFTGGDGNNLVRLSGSATKVVSAGGGDDVVESTDASDGAWGHEAWASADWIDGGLGNDRLHGGPGDDELRGGGGADHLDGGPGADVYVVDAAEDSWDVLDDRTAPLLFVNINGDRYLAPPPQALWDGLMQTLLDYGGHVDGMRASGYLPVTAAVLNTLMQLDALPVRITTDDDGWQSHYTAISSRGLDALIARMKGEPAFPYSTFGAHGEQRPRPAVVFDDATLGQLQADTVRFGLGVDPAGLQLQWTMLDTDEGERRALSISWGGPGGVHVLLTDDDALPGAGIEQFSFADGTRMSMGQMLALAPPWPPVEPPAVTVGQAIGVLQILEDDTWTYGIPADAFVHDGEPALRYELRLADGSGELPAWLAFDPVTGTLSGTPDNAAAGVIELRLTALIGDAPQAAQTLTLQVLNTNDAPTMNPLAPLQILAGEALDWAFNAENYNDPDFGDSYTVSVGSADGAALPAWLRFDAATGRLQGTPTSSDIDELVLLVRLQDASGAWSEQVLLLTVGAAPGQTVVGTASNDLLQGGAGADTLQGGLGDDTYHVNDMGDRVTERLDQGHDLVVSSVTHTLRSHVEDLELIGSADINGTGNALSNRVVGNTGNNRLNGAAGTDTLVGSQGDDRYTVDNPEDLVVELAGEGVDTVNASIDWALGEHLEHLSLTGSADIDGLGNALDNVLRGNAGHNSLAGGAGSDSLNGAAGNDTLWGMAGNDTLVGGLGNDTYVFGRGDGTDTVRENDSTVGNADVLRFLDDVATDQLWFRRVSSHLEVNIIGTNDRLTLSNWYRGDQYKVEQFQLSDGQALVYAQVDSLVQAMAAFAPPPMGQTTLTPDRQMALMPVIAAGWN